MKNLLLSCLLLSSLSLFSCSQDQEEDDTTNDGPTILISAGGILATTEITASPGEEVTILNEDSIPHQIISESAEDAFDDTGDFDVLVPTGGAGILIVPDGNPGDTFFFYCGLVEEGLTPANGMIVIE